MAITQFADVEEFGGGLLETPLGVDLREAYVRQPGAQESVVERLYGDLRRRTVHYMKVGSDELRDELARHANFPAQIASVEKQDGTPEVHFQWAQVLSGMQLFGDPRDPRFLEKMRKNADLAGRIVGAWVYLAGVATASHALRLGIDTKRLGKHPRREPG